MRLPLPIRPKGRTPQDERRVPLKIMRPQELRSYVGGQGRGGSQVTCLQEMAVMMACFTTNEFSQADCAKEITSFQSCVQKHRQDWEAQQELLKKGVTVGAKNLNHIQINSILKRYPTSK